MCQQITQESMLLVIDRRDNLDMARFLYFGFQVWSAKTMENG